MLFKPQLIIVTGRPGAGKTTFAKALSETIHFPLLCRDEIKEGYLQTLQISHDNAIPDQINAIAGGTFLHLARQYLEHNISLIMEAAYQHHVWEDYLEFLADKADITIIICRIDEAIAKERYLKRGLSDPSREYFHGDPGVDAYRKGEEVTLPPYREPELPYKTLYVDTLGEYKPSLQEFTDLLRRENPEGL